MLMWSKASFECLRVYNFARCFPKSLKVKIKTKDVFKGNNSLISWMLGSAIKNLGLFSKSPGDFKMETMDF